MCGRYVLSLRPGEVRQRLQDAQMPVEDAPDDDDVRQSYNFAPGYHGLVYRADTPDSGAGSRSTEHDGESEKRLQSEGARRRTAATLEEDLGKREIHYKLQAMKWGLVPFWTKRPPDYGSALKTINCRDDSLYEDRGMWTTMKRRKRCIVVAQGFYEWLKKNNGREKIPHFVKRRDGQLMCFAGLWDCVQYEGSDEKLYTYTIITTDSNKELNFLHDRMPVILDNGSDAVRIWLDPNRSEWSKELQGLLKPFQGELEIYPVSKDVGKVGNNSPTFIIPLDSKENKNNIANFFGTRKNVAKVDVKKEEVDGVEVDALEQSRHMKQEEDDRRTVNVHSTEDNAPKPAPSTHALDPTAMASESPGKSLGQSSPPRGLKREHDDTTPSKAAAAKPPSSKKVRSATSNGTVARSPSKAADGSKKITAFFGK